MKLGSPLCHQDVKMTRLRAGGAGGWCCASEKKGD